MGVKSESMEVVVDENDHFWQLWTLVKQRIRLAVNESAHETELQFSSRK